MVALRYELAPGYQLVSHINGLNECQVRTPGTKPAVCGSNWLWQLARSGENYIELEISRDTAASSTGPIALNVELLASNSGDDQSLTLGTLAIPANTVKPGETTVLAYSLDVPMKISLLQTQKHRLKRTAKYFRDK